MALQIIHEARRMLFDYLVGYTLTTFMKSATYCLFVCLFACLLVCFSQNSWFNDEQTRRKSNTTQIKTRREKKQTRRKSNATEEKNKQNISPYYSTVIPCVAFLSSAIKYGEKHNEIRWYNAIKYGDITLYRPIRRTIALYCRILLRYIAVLLRYIAVL